MLPKDIKIVFHDEKPHYFPGSIVKGEVIIIAEKPETECKSIVVGILGQAHMVWTVHSGSGNRRRRRTYTNKITYIKEDSVVWKKENSPSGELSPGEHSFPFEYTLPDEIPPSFESLHGQVRFGINVEIARSGILKGNLKSQSLITVKVKPSPDLLASCKEPKVVDLADHVKFCCFDFGSIKVTCDLPQTVFTIGEAIPVNLQIDNQSTKALRVHTSLHQVNTYISSGGTKFAPVRRVSLVISPQIDPGVMTAFEDTTRLKIPADLSPTLKSCACIRVEYVLVIKAVAHSPGSSKSMSLPLVVIEEPMTS